MRWIMMTSFVLVAASGLRGQEPVDFQADVWPILERSCLECHRSPYKDDRGRTRNPKGGLRLDGKNGILVGGNTEKVVRPGDPADSLLFILTTLEKSWPGMLRCRPARRFFFLPMIHSLCMGPA